MAIRTLWECWQVDFLIKNYEKMEAAQMAEALGKSVTSVRSKLTKCKITKTKNKTYTRSSFNGRRIVAHRYKGTTREKEVCRDVASALNEYGFLWGEELMEYIVACNNISTFDENIYRKTKEVDINKIYNFIISEQKRVEAGE